MILVNRKFLVIKYFRVGVTSVATAGAPVPNMPLMNIVIHVIFHR